MAILDTRSRSGYLFMAVAVGHIILISAQVNVRSGVPLLQAVVFGAFAEVQRATSGAVDAVRGAWDGYLALHGVYERNEALARENGYLKVKLQQTRALALESQHLRRLLDLRDRSQLPTRAAEVIGTSATADFRTVTIDRGTGDGLRPDMAVISPEGAVGRVVMPSRSAAKVQLLVDRSAAAAVRVERSGAQGIVLGSGESLLRLEYVSSSADLKVGDVVVTSGLDGLYPPGFVVGRIETVDRTVGGEAAVTLLRVLVTIAVALALQTTLARFLVHGSIGVDLVLVAVVYLGLTTGPVAGLVSGSVAGLAQDALASGVVGIGGLAKTIVGYLTGLVGTAFIVTQTVPRFLMFFGATIIQAAVTLTLDAVLQRGVQTIPIASITAQAVGNALLGVVLFQLTEALPVVLERRRAMGRGRRR